MRDVTNDLCANEVDASEFVNLVSMRLGQAEFTSPTRIDFPNSATPEFSMIYSKDGNLQRVESNLQPPELAAIANEVKAKLLSPTSTKFNRQIMFSSIPVIGSWSGNFFSIIEAPPQAPRPPQLWADHPVVIEFPFEAATDTFTNMQRADRLLHEYALLLSLYVPSIRTQSRSMQQLWGIPLEGNNSISSVVGPKPIWTQGYYSVDNYPRFTDKKTNTANMDPIKLQRDEAYYAYGYPQPHDALDLPESLERWIAKYATNEQKTKLKLLRAAYWLRHALNVSPQSASAALISAVQAVETLVPKSSGTPCPTCGLMTGSGPTKKFRDFLEAYAPAEDQQTRKVQDLIYRQRSQLTHGHELLLTDAEIRFGWTKPLHAQESFYIRYAAQIARVAAINWFEAQ